MRRPRGTGWPKLTACQSRRGAVFCNLTPVDEIPCAANRTDGFPPCTKRDEHLRGCNDDDCGGCAPRPAVHGYLCRRHYARVERAGARLDALHAFAGPDTRARHSESSASTTAGPRVPLTALQLDLAELDRLNPGAVPDWLGATVALDWARRVQAVAARHPLEPTRERVHRVRCGSCRQVAVIAAAPELAGADQVLTCKACGWTTADQDHAEAARYAEALVRDPYRARGGRASTRLTGDDRAGIARLVDALR